MATEEGRARFVAQARPLIAQIEAPALGAMLRRRLAEVARLDAAEVEALLPSKLAEKRTPAVPERKIRRTTSNPVRLLALLLSTPALAERVPEGELGGIGAEMAALREVTRFFREDPKRNAAMASAYFEGTEHAAAITEALREPLLKQVESHDFDEEAEVDGLIEGFRRGRLGRRREQLVALMNAGTATAADEAEYRDLQARLATARSGTSGVEAGSKF
jgi:DNA primase